MFLWSIYRPQEYYYYYYIIVTVYLKPFKGLFTKLDYFFFLILVIQKKTTIDYVLKA